MSRPPAEAMRPLRFSALAALAAFPLLTSASETSAHLCRFCSSNLAPVTVESSAYRKYARDRHVDFLNLALDITPDFKARTIQGSVALKFKPLTTPLEELRLDAVDMTVISASSSEPGLKHQVTNSEIVLSFSPAIPVGKETTVTIHYSAEPKQGLYFRTTEMGYPETHLWTQGEATESRHWFPCFDDPVEKLTSEVTCHLPDGMVALSNGRQTSVTKDSGGLTAYHWQQDKPHTNYLIALVAGNLEKIEDKHRDLPLEFWAIPSDLPYAQNSFRTTRHVMEFFEREIGVHYPWAKYAQATIRDYHWGGMENTSLTTLNANTLFDKDTENLYDSHGLVAHELAHQWFGDLVTCKDWSQIWLNEGFATYYDWLWEGNFGGNNDLLFNLYAAAKGILEKTKETRGIVWRKYNNPGDMFNYLAYPKGAWVLHMLRSRLGPDLYRKCIRTYVERYAYSSVTTDSLRSVIEEISGLNFDRFFDQWVYGIGAPQLDVDYSWDEKSGLAKVTVKQTQKISEDALLFEFPLTVRFGVKGDRIDRSVQIKEKEEDFYFPLKSSPETVRIDPEVTVLSKINFKPAKPMLFAQLANNADAIGQLLALDQLTEKPDKEAVGNIQKALQNADYFRVRIRAAEVLRLARSPEALSALKESLTQPDARVRNAVVSALGGFFEPEASKALLSVIATEKNPGIAATALRALGPYHTPEVKKTLEEALQHSVYRERLADAAISAMKAQGDPAFAPTLQNALTSREKVLPTNTLAAGLDTLGFLSRNEIRKDGVRTFLIQYVTHPKENIRVAAIGALGSLEDPQSFAVLETFSGASGDKPEKAAAEKALEKIRAARKPNEELKDLRTEISELKKSEQELKKDLETLRKKFEPKP